MQYYFKIDIYRMLKINYVELFNEISKTAQQDKLGLWNTDIFKKEM